MLSEYQCLHCIYENNGLEFGCPTWCFHEKVRYVKLPVRWGASENPYPGIEGAITSNASSSLPPYEAGLVNIGISL